MTSIPTKRKPIFPAAATLAARRLQTLSESSAVTADRRLILRTASRRLHALGAKVSFNRSMVQLHREVPILRRGTTTEKHAIPGGFKRVASVLEVFGFSLEIWTGPEQPKAKLMALFSHRSGHAEIVTCPSGTFSSEGQNTETDGWFWAVGNLLDIRPQK